MWTIKWKLFNFVTLIFKVKMGDEEQLLLEELQDSLEDIGYTKVGKY